MSRLTIEPKANVFVGNLNGRVRDKVWQKIVEKWQVPAIMVFTTNTEQGYKIRSNLDPTREIVEIEGLTLVNLYPTEV